MSLVNSGEVIRIIRRTLNRVDPRLVEHGERVAYMVLKMLDAEQTRDVRQRRDICMTAILHDVGAYKTEEIDRMVQFETREAWRHAIYGYLFLKNLSPLEPLASAVLYHHLDYHILRTLDAPYADIAQLINLADRVDTYVINRKCSPPQAALMAFRDERFSAWALDLFHQMEGENPELYPMLQDGSFSPVLEARLLEAPFTAEEINGYLRMVVSSIDFRSPFTVTHTITTERISEALALRMDLTPEECYKVKYGSLLHDLGKIAIPVDILESSGKLNPREMAIMRTHVEITGEILGDSADVEMLHIAVRHHEKLDGSGYPLGLTGDLLTRSERIVAVADMVSALSSVRSYKDAFSKESVTSILEEQKRGGRLCGETVDAMLSDYDAIMEEVRVGCAPILSVYQAIEGQYAEISRRCQALDPA